MDPKELVKLIDILNPENRPGRITIITRMGPENMRVKLPHLIRAVRGAGQIVTWVTDPMHGNTMKAPCGLKTRSFDRILVISFPLMALFSVFACPCYIFVPYNIVATRV
jgi:3-deoxy-7-phosphoheptulonate synthase